MLSMNNNDPWMQQWLVGAVPITRHACRRSSGCSRRVGAAMRSSRQHAARSLCKHEQPTHASNCFSMRTPSHILCAANARDGWVLSVCKTPTLPCARPIYQMDAEYKQSSNPASCRAVYVVQPLLPRSDTRCPPPNDVHEHDVHGAAVTQIPF